MLHSEKRLVPRTLLGTVPTGAMYLSVHGERIHIDKLRDISGSGLSFSISKPVDVSQRIAVEYADPKARLEVFGRVAWCSPKACDHHGPEGYLVGVELLSPMMLFALLPRA